MRIAVFGATGMAGAEIVTEALHRGHRVTACSRTPRDDSCHERLSVVSVDVSDTPRVIGTLSAVDAAVLSVRMSAGREHEILSLTQSLLDAAQATGVPVLVVGGSAALRSPTDPTRRLVDDREFVPEQWASIARASLGQFDVCRTHPNPCWTYISPPAVFEPGLRTGKHRRGQDTLLTNGDGSSRISAADFAIAVIDEIENPSGAHHFTVVEDVAPRPT